MAQSPLLPEKCKDHDKLVTFSCVTCDNSLVCNECITSTHKKHEFSKLEEFISSQKGILRNVLKDADKLLNNIQNQLNTVSWALEDNATRSESIIKQLRKNGKRLKKVVDRIVEENIEKCKRTKTLNHETITQVEDHLKSICVKLNSKTAMCKKLLESDHVGNILKAKSLGNDIQESTTLERSQTHPKLTMSYFKEKFEQGHKELEKILEIEDVDDNVIAYQTDKMFERNCEKGIVWSLTPASDDKIWVGYENTCDLELMSSNGNVIEVFELNAWPYDISIERKEGEARMVISCEDKSVYQIFPGTDFEPLELFQTEGEPQGVAITLDGCILVATSKPTKLLQYNFQGEELRSLNFDDSRNPLLTKTGRIKINPKNGDIHVVNLDPDCLVVFDKDLHYKFTYKGEKRRHLPPGYKTGNRTFSPKDVEFDQHGNTLITDSGTNTIILIDSRGSFLYTLLHDDLGPYSLSLQHDHLLIVGYEDGTSKSFHVTSI